MKEFEELFKRSQNVKRTKTHSTDVRQHNSSRPIRLLEGQRSQAIGILLKSLHVDLDEITHAVVAMETGLVDVESLKALNEMVVHVLAFKGMIGMLILFLFVESNKGRIIKDTGSSPWQQWAATGQT